MFAHEVKRGMVIVIPSRHKTFEGLKVARVSPGKVKSYLHISFEGDHDCTIPRNEEVSEYPIDDVCEACEKVDDYLQYYDNGIFGPSGWLCSDCIATAEMEL